MSQNDSRYLHIVTICLFIASVLIAIFYGVTAYQSGLNTEISLNLVWMLITVGMIVTAIFYAIGHFLLEKNDSKSTVYRAES